MLVLYEIRHFVLKSSKSCYNLKGLNWDKALKNEGDHKTSFREMSQTKKIHKYYELVENVGISRSDTPLIY